jgi:hypothetical protein
MCAAIFDLTKETSSGWVYGSSGHLCPQGGGGMLHWNLCSISFVMNNEVSLWVPT